MQVNQAKVIERATANMTSHTAKVADVATRALAAAQGLGKEIVELVKAGERGQTLSAKIPTICDQTEAYEAWIDRAELLAADELGAITITEGEHVQFLTDPDAKESQMTLRVVSG